MSNDATVRAQLKTILDTVTNIGNVYNRAKYSDLYGDFINQVKATISGADQLRIWFIVNTGYSPQDIIRDEISIPHLKPYAYRIRGYCGVDDANSSETAFFTLAELVADTLTENRQTIANLSNTFNCSYPALSFDTQMFGGVLCHFAEISLQVTVSSRGA